MTTNAARDTLGGAMSAAGRLPEQLGTAMLDVAREAFMSGLRITAVVSAVIAVTLGVIVAVFLRHVPANPES